mgnify:CR=1 FL=1
MKPVRRFSPLTYMERLMLLNISQKYTLIAAVRELFQI